MPATTRDFTTNVRPDTQAAAPRLIHSPRNAYNIAGMKLPDPATGVALNAPLLYHNLHLIILRGTHENPPIPWKNTDAFPRKWGEGG